MPVINEIAETPEEREARAAREEEARVNRAAEDLVAADMDRFARELRQNPKNVIYRDYEMKDDFSMWLKGYREKIRSGYGYSAAQNDEVNAEVVRSMSGKLKPGTPLDTYERLPGEVQGDYKRLTESLTREFLDPQEKRKFLKDFGYDKRKKGQSIKEFMQAIVNHQNRYSDMPDKIVVGQASVENATKVRDGIRRFMTGMRDKKGRKNKELKVVLNYNLMEEEDLNWKNAVEIAVRWENSNDVGSATDSSSGSSSGDDDDEAVEAVESGKGAKKKQQPKKGKGKRETAAAALELKAVRQDVAVEVATLSDKVEANTRDIKGIKSQQERTEVNMAAWKSETSSTLGRILQVVEEGRQQQQYRQPFQNSYRQPFQSNYRFPQRPPVPYQQQQPRPFQPRPYQQRPFPSWKARVGQTQQTGFGFNSATPSRFPRQPAPQPPAQNAAAPNGATAAPAAATVAAALVPSNDDDGSAQQLYDQQMAHQMFEQQQKEQQEYEQQQHYEQYQQYQQQVQGDPQGIMAMQLGPYFDPGEGNQEAYENDIIGAVQNWNFQ